MALFDLQNCIFPILYVVHVNVINTVLACLSVYQQGLSTQY